MLQANDDEKTIAALPRMASATTTTRGDGAASVDGGKRTMSSIPIFQISGTELTPRYPRPVVCFDSDWLDGFQGEHTGSMPCNSVECGCVGRWWVSMCHLESALLDLGFGAHARELAQGG